MTAKQPKKAATSKGSSKRKRLVDDEDDASQTKLCFKKVRKEDYDSSIHRDMQSSSTPNKSSQRLIGEVWDSGSIKQEGIQVSSQQLALPEAKDFPIPMYMYNSFSKVRISKGRANVHPAQQMTIKAEDAELSTDDGSSSQAPTSSNFITLSQGIVNIRSRAVRSHEGELYRAWEQTKGYLSYVVDLDVYDLIACMVQIITQRVIGNNIDIHGLMRAISMEYQGVNLEYVQQAWSCAETGFCFDLNAIPPHDYGQVDRAFGWELSNTSLETLKLMHTPIDSVDDEQVYAVLRLSYKLAAELVWKSVEQPIYNAPHAILVVVIMRRLCRQGYSFEPMLKAMALDIKGDQGAEQVWHEVRCTEE